MKKYERIRDIKYSRGITLIALVVTIIVLVILAGVSIQMLTGENGIITQMQKAKVTNRLGRLDEELKLYYADVTLANRINAPVENLDNVLARLQNEGVISSEEKIILKERLSTDISIIGSKDFNVENLLNNDSLNNDPVNNDPVNNDPVNNDPVNNDPVNNDPVILTDLTGTTWEFNDELDIPISSPKYMIDFEATLSFEDYFYDYMHLDEMDISINSWYDVVNLLPMYMENLDYNIIENNLEIADNQNLKNEFTLSWSYLNFDGIDSYKIMGWENFINDELSTYPNCFDLPEINGTISISYYEDVYEDISFGILWQMFLQGTNEYYYNRFNDLRFGKTITITGGQDATNSDLIEWLQNNATQIL